MQQAWSDSPSNRADHAAFCAGGGLSGPPKSEEEEETDRYAGRETDGQTHKQIETHGETDR